MLIISTDFIDISCWYIGKMIISWKLIVLYRMMPVVLLVLAVLKSDIWEVAAKKF